MRSAWTHDKLDRTVRRGRQEQRMLATRTLPCDRIDWPGITQIVKYATLVEVQGRTRLEFHYAVTNVPREKATAADILSWRRGRWGVENRTFHVRDVAFREDHSQVRTGQLPTVLASVRNAAIDFLRGTGETNITAALRSNALRLDRLLPKLGIFN